MDIFYLFSIKLKGIYFLLSLIIGSLGRLICMQKIGT